MSHPASRHWVLGLRKFRRGGHPCVRCLTTSPTTSPTTVASRLFAIDAEDASSRSAASWPRPSRKRGGTSLEKIQQPPQLVYVLRHRFQGPACCPTSPTPEVTDEPATAPRTGHHTLRADRHHGLSGRAWRDAAAARRRLEQPCALQRPVRTVANGRAAPAVGGDLGRRGLLGPPTGRRLPALDGGAWLLSGNAVTCLCLDAADRPWVGPVEGGLGWFDGERWRLCPFPPEGPVRVLAARAAGGVWAATSEAVWLVDDPLSSPLPLAGGQAGAVEVVTLLDDGAGVLAGGADGLYRLAVGKAPEPVEPEVLRTCVGVGPRQCRQGRGGVASGHAVHRLDPGGRGGP